jgi:hypothetical protein
LTIANNAKAAVADMYIHACFLKSKKYNREKSAKLTTRYTTCGMFTFFLKVSVSIIPKAAQLARILVRNINPIRRTMVGLDLNLMRHSSATRPESAVWVFARNR